MRNFNILHVTYVDVHEELQGRRCIRTRKVCVWYVSSKRLYILHPLRLSLLLLASLQAFLQRAEWEK